MPVSTIRRAFSGATMVWAVALPIATFLMSRDQAPIALHVGAFAVYFAGSIVCHQLPARTFQLWSHHMPVCARCAGIYFGAALAVVTLRVTRHDEHGGGPIVPGAARGSLLIAALPTLATIAYEWTTGETPSNALRALAGVPLGGVVALLIGSAREVN